MSNFERINPHLLDVLHYTTEKEIEKEEVTLSVAGAITMVSSFGSSLLKPETKKTMKMSALHNAFRAGNNRVCELILTYMSKIEFNASRRFKDMLHELTDLKCF